MDKEIIKNTIRELYPFYILTFTDEDYDKLLEGVTFFELVRAKKLEIQLASSYETFITATDMKQRRKLKQLSVVYNLPHCDTHLTERTFCLAGTM